MIPFNIPPFVGNEKDLVLDVMAGTKMCGDGKYTELCHEWFENTFNCTKALLTPSCTAALEMAAILVDIVPGDEVIMPSFTFVSTANAFVLRGAKIIFVDIRPDTMNIDEKKIEAAITSKTKAIVPVHYAGVSCEMDAIMALAAKYNLWVIEDAAQGVMSSYNGQALGTIGHIGCFSFHETKNYTSGGEGGAIIINAEPLKLRSEIVREKGTNRSQFYRGQVDKYTWRDVGSSFLMSDLQAAYLFGQLKNADLINEKRLKLWHLYFSELTDLIKKELITAPHIPADCVHNAHMFYIKLKNVNERTRFIDFMRNNNITTPFHYIPLHACDAGIKFGSFYGKDDFTTKESERLVRLPLYFSLEEKDVLHICSVITRFFNL